MGLTRQIKHGLTLTRMAATFGKGYLRYLLCNKNAERPAFLALRNLFCFTNGRLNDVLAYCHRMTHSPYQLDSSASVIPYLSEASIASIVQQMDRDGYYLFEHKLSEALCHGLTDLACQAKCVVTNEAGLRVEPQVFDPRHTVGVRYDLAQQTIMENSIAQKLVSDPGLIAIAQGYFRAKAVQDLVAMWWSVPSTHPSSEAAQMYHFDMDRVKFLKFFLYLSDVNEDNGPHSYIAGSHRRLPKALRQDKRHTDEEVFAHYPDDKRIEITGPRGTLCVVDTRGLHKGKQLILGSRLVFQIEYAINLFGHNYPPIYLNERFTPDFMKTVNRYPYTFMNYVHSSS